MPNPTLSEAIARSYNRAETDKDPILSAEVQLINASDGLSSSPALGVVLLDATTNKARSSVINWERLTAFLQGVIDAAIELYVEDQVRQNEPRTSDG
jgi:hypothetical protein